jgi:hypothetical protein
LLTKKRVPNIPFCYLLSIYPKRGLGALLKKEEEKDRKVKERGQMSQLKKTLPLSIPSSPQSFFKVLKEEV